MNRSFLIFFKKAVIVRLSFFFSTVDTEKTKFQLQLKVGMYIGCEKQSAAYKCYK